MENSKTSGLPLILKKKKKIQEYEMNACLQQRAASWTAGSEMRRSNHA